MALVSLCELLFAQVGAVSDALVMFFVTEKRGDRDICRTDTVAQTAFDASIKPVSGGCIRLVSVHV